MRTASSRRKIAVLAPIPRASDSKAAVANAGLRRRRRAPKRRSFPRPDNQPPGSSNPGTGVGAGLLSCRSSAINLPSRASASAARRASSAERPSRRSSSKRSSRCWPSSSPISSWRAGSRSRPSSSARISLAQSAKFCRRDAIHRLDEGPPDAALLPENSPAGGRDPVIAAPPLPGLLHPAALHEAARFETIQQGVERRDVERERAAGALLDQLADLVPVTPALLDQRQDQQPGAPLLELAVQRAQLHILKCNIWVTQSRVKPTSVTHIRSRSRARRRRPGHHRRGWRRIALAAARGVTHQGQKHECDP